MDELEKSQLRNRKNQDAILAAEEKRVAEITCNKTDFNEDLVGGRTAPFSSQSETIAVASTNDSDNPTTADGLTSVSWPNVTKNGEKTKSLARKSSHPFLTLTKGLKRPATPGGGEITFSDLSTSLCGSITFGVRCAWECGSMVVQEVSDLLDGLWKFFQGAPGGCEREKLRMNGRCGQQADQELMDLMENQTQTLLEINKLLREELATVKEEREAAEKMVTRVENHCREAIARQSEHVDTCSLFDLLYGAGASQAAFGSGGIAVEKPNKKITEVPDVETSPALVAYGPINRPVSWVRFPK